MPFAVDEQAMSGKPFERDGRMVNPVLQIDPAKPPVKLIPHAEFPRIVYMHPLEPFETIEHRNDRFEVVGEEVVPTTHLTKAVGNEVELQAALAEGWVKEPYIAKATPDNRSKLYRQKPAKALKQA